MELDINLDVDSAAAVPQTPARPQSTRASRSRRGVRREESSSEEMSPTPIVQTMPGSIRTRSHRASKSAALTKMTAASSAIRIDEFDDEEEEGPEVTSEEDSDESDQYAG